MRGEDEMPKLLEDLRLIKSTVARSNSVFRFVNVSQAMALVGLWGGAGLAVMAGFAYLLTVRFGAVAAAPQVWQLAFYLSLGLFITTVGALKTKLILKHVRKTYHDFTILRLVSDISTEQSIPLIVSFALAGAGLLAFLFSRGLVLYIIPAISILLGLTFISFLNVFYLKEMLVAGNWLIITGLVALFYADHLPPSLAVIITFACGFGLLYAANRFMGKVS